MHLKSLSLSAIALVAGLGVAAAQPQQPAPAWQPQDSTKSMQGGKEEPSSHIPTVAPPETGVFVNGKLSVPGAPAESQTEPAKFSERNARLDTLPLIPQR